MMNRDSVRYVRRIFVTLCIGIVLTLVGRSSAEPIDLTLKSAVEIAMRNSYRIKRLELGIERTRLYLKARQAQLKSFVSMNLKAPEFEAISDYKWNSTLQRDEIVRQNTRLWEMGFSISQPMILLGHPTNGYLSLNTKTYRYRQEEGDVNYYNRLFVKFTQPFFQPNFLKNNIEDAELDLQREDLDFIADQVRLIEDVADDYYDLFELAYQISIHSRHVEQLERAQEVAERVPDPARAMEAIQVQVELGNAREQLYQGQGRYRIEMDQLKQRLGMETDVELHLNPAIVLDSVTVDDERAVESGLMLRPRLQREYIQRRKEEVDLDNTRGRNSFRLDLEVTYGLERQDEFVRELWGDYNSSYSLSLNAYIPIWDWGRRKALLEADMIGVRRSGLLIKEVENQIISEISSTVRNLREFQQRALRMADNLQKAKLITERSITQYENDVVSLLDLLRSISTERETELRFADTYLGYRRAILRLMLQSYYDFENNVLLFDRFGVRREES
jgi:outer membrane protein TolC